ncbi:hypothetical protein ABE79_03195 [Proteus mirabilis]|nr:hypothetical protein ABE79_03195 [Proteus mirabilis]
MGIIAWIIFGLIAGILAKFLMPGSYDIGLIWTCILGIVGAVVGGAISNFFGKGKVDGFNFGSFVVAIIGAIVVLYLAKNLRKLIPSHPIDIDNKPA